MDDTIVAIATPLGEGGLGVVRLSGPQAFPIADQLFQSSNKLQKANSHTLHHGWITEKKQTIDEAVAACFRAPHSYTGEDVVEISCHGSPAVLKTVVRLAEGKGARPAHPGEFTQRAFLNGKMDLLQAEAVAELIHAKSEKARSAATEQLRGAFSQQIKSIRDPLVELLAHLEAHLDFVDDEIPGVSWKNVSATIKSIQEKAESFIALGAKGRWLREGIRVAIAGKPNVGKSSLFNALLSLDRAIVTDIPGTTRDILEERVDWAGYPFVLLDTAGLRETMDPVELLGTSRARDAHAAADIVLIVLDGSVKLSSDDQKIMDALNNKPVVVALNKSDQGQTVEPSQFSFPAVPTSVVKNQGLSELKAALIGMVAKNSAESESQFLTNERHVQHLTRYQNHLSSVLSAIEKRHPTEAIALDLRQALLEVGHITGENTSEDVLNSIFRQFCIGK